MLNRTLHPQRKDYLHLRVALLLLSLLTSYNLLPLLLVLETVNTRSHLHTVHAPDPNGNYAICNDPPVKIIITVSDLQLPDNTREIISPDWRELWNAPVSTLICIIDWHRNTIPGNYSSGIATNRVYQSEHAPALSANCCSAPGYNSLSTAKASFSVFIILTLPKRLNFLAC